MRMFASRHAMGLGSIKARILLILGLLAFGYLLLLALVQFTAAATHEHINQASTSLFPAALRLKEAKTSFEDLQKRYKDAVLLEDPAALLTAEKDAEVVAGGLSNLRSLVDASPQLATRADDLISRFSGIRSRSHDVYSAMVNSKVAIPEQLRERAAALAVDDKELATSMVNLDDDDAVQFRAQLGLIDGWSRRSRIAGWCMLLIALAVCGGGWSVLRYRVFLPLEGLAHRMQDIAQGDGDLTGRVEVNGSNELDEVGFWFNVFIDRVEQVVVRVSSNARTLAEAARGLAETARETARETALEQEQATRIMSSMSEIAMAVRDISKTTQHAADDAREAERNAHSGGRTIHATVDTIQLLLDAKRATATESRSWAAPARQSGRSLK